MNDPNDAECLIFIGLLIISMAIGAKFWGGLWLDSVWRRPYSARSLEFLGMGTMSKTAKFKPKLWIRNGKWHFHPSYLSDLSPILNYMAALFCCRQNNKPYLNPWIDRWIECKQLTAKP